MRIPRPRFRHVGRHRRHRRRFRPSTRLLGVTFAASVATAALTAGDASTAAHADPAHIVAAPETVEEVVNNVRLWLLGIVAAVASFFAVAGALRITASNGDPAEHEKGKTALKSAAIGYLLALISPLLVTIVGSWVR